MIKLCWKDSEELSLMFHYFYLNDQNFGCSVFLFAEVLHRLSKKLGFNNVKNEHFKRFDNLTT